MFSAARKPSPSQATAGWSSYSGGQKISPRPLPRPRKAYSLPANAAGHSYDTFNRSEQRKRRRSSLFHSPQRQRFPHLARPVQNQRPGPNRRIEQEQTETTEK